MEKPKRIKNHFKEIFRNNNKKILSLITVLEIRNCQKIFQIMRAGDSKTIFLIIIKSQLRFQIVN
jgi:hypothetical protein